MTNKYCDSPIHKCLCLFLALIFFFTIVLSVPAAADSVRPNEPVGWKDGDTFRDILLAVLDSWGISFSKSDPDDDTSILEYSDQLMQEFYDANETTQELFWDLVQYGASETGKIILDFLGVNKIRQFANWLVDKFSLQDNSSTDTTPVPVLTFPHLPANVSLDTLLSEGLYFHNTSSPYAVIQGFSYNSVLFDTITFYPYYRLSNGTYNYCGCFFSNVVIPSNTTLQFLVRATNNVTVSVLSVTVTQRNSGEYYFNLGGGNSLASTLNPDLPIFSSHTAAFDYFRPFTQPSQSPPLVINTTIINIPSEDMDPQDGLEIEVPGTNWGDSIYTILDIIERLVGIYDSTQLNINTVIDLISTLLQGLQKSVSVENIPGAVVLDYDEYDIPLETEWSLVDGFFSEETEGSPFSTLTTILYGFPEPIILFFSVIVVFVVAYGFIRLGRDSH